MPVVVHAARPVGLRDSITTAATAEQDDAGLVVTGLAGVAMLGRRRRS